MPKAWVLFVVAVLLDTLGTTLFKMGANNIEESLKDGWLAHWENILQTLKRKEILWGLLVYVIEFILWVSFLSTVDLSKAFPMSSITIVLILLVSRIYLQEDVNHKRWFGAALIIAGMTLLGSGS